MGGTVLDFGVCVRILGKGVCFFVLRGWDFGCFGVIGGKEGWEMLELREGK